MSSTIRRPALHSTIHASVLGKRSHENIQSAELEEQWNTDDESSEDESDYSVYSDDDDDGDEEHSFLE